MKSTTLESRIDFAISATFQGDISTEQAVANVNKLLSAFKDIGQAQSHHNADVLQHSFFEDDIVYN